MTRQAATRCPPAPSPHTGRTIKLWLGLLVVSVTAASASAQRDSRSEPSFRDRVVDRIILSDGAKLWGFAVSEKPAKMVFRTAWLKQQHPDLFATRIVPSLPDSQQSPRSVTAELLLEMIDKLPQQGDAAHLQRVGLLREIQARLSADDNTDPDFLLIEVPRGQLRRIDLQPDRRRQLSRLAMLNQIPDVEVLGEEAVLAQLQAIPDQQRLTSLPGQQSSPERDRDRILAAVDVRLNSALRLIQTGETFIPENTKPDLTLLVSTLLGGNLRNLLNELLNEGQAPPAQAAVSNTLPPAAARLADAGLHRTVVLSGFDVNAAAGLATVTKQLFHKDSNDTWLLMLNISSGSSVADLQPGQIADIENDPQIKEISAIISGTGLASNQLTTALRLGAVVRNALNTTDANFNNSIQSVITTTGLQRSGPLTEIVLGLPDKNQTAN